MRAVVQKRYGGSEQLQLVELEKPNVNELEVLIEIHATNISSGDMRINTLNAPLIIKPIMRLIFGWKGPRHSIRGVTAAGVIKEVGAAVTKYKVGQKVYFINSLKAGCLAEYITLSEKAIIAPMPSNMSFIEAAPLSFGAMSAYHFINKNTIHQDDEVLIYGASGAVGSYAIQLAVYYGGIVTAVCSEKNHSKMKSLGATYTIDYHQEDFRQLSKKYDIIFDAVMKITKKSSKIVLKENGRYLTMKRPTKEDRSRLLKLNDIVEEGALKTLIDEVYPLESYRKAHDKVYSNHKVGNVIIEVRTDSSNP